MDLLLVSPHWHNKPFLGSDYSGRTNAFCAQPTLAQQAHLGSPTAVQHSLLQVHSKSHNKLHRHVLTLLLQSWPQILWGSGSGACPGLDQLHSAPALRLRSAHDTDSGSQQSHHPADDQGIYNAALTPAMHGQEACKYAPCWAGTHCLNDGLDSRLRRSLSRGS